MKRECDPDWLPGVRGSLTDRAACAAGPHSLGILPDRLSGFSVRSHHTMAALRRAGLDPVAVTALGFPRQAGRVAPPVETVEGTRTHRLDLGAGYPADVPFDRYLEDFAWLASGVVRDERPAILHAASGLRGRDVALVGMALRERHDLPLVYDVRSFFETTWSSREGAEAAELARRRHAAETRAMAAADAVVTIAEAMREDIVERGIPSERVFVVPNGVDADQFTPRPPDPGLRAGWDARLIFGYITPRPPARGPGSSSRAAPAAGAGRDTIAYRRRRGGGRSRGAGAPGVAGGAVFVAGACAPRRGAGHYAVLAPFVVPRRTSGARHVRPLSL